jgi:hypothetical protein
MGVGDRHSKRGDKAKAPAAISRAFAIDDRELDDPFSAWDEDDALAQKPPHLIPETQTSSAHTRIERRNAVSVPTPKRELPAQPSKIADGSARRMTPLADALLDPVAGRDIVISRARTLDDPLTTRVLAEIARGEARSAAASDDAPTIERMPAHSPTRDDIAISRRRTSRRAVLREEPFRKK